MKFLNDPAYSSSRSNSGPEHISAILIRVLDDLHKNRLGGPIHEDLPGGTLTTTRPAIPSGGNHGYSYRPIIFESPKAQEVI